MKIVRIDWKAFVKAYGMIFAILIPAVIFNSYFNDVLGYNMNYFYIYDTHGFPLTFLYLGERAHYGWFSINWFYTISMIVIFSIIMYGIYLASKLPYAKGDTFDTRHIFTKNAK